MAQCVPKKQERWVGISLCGVLSAVNAVDPNVLGPPAPAMVKQVKGWIRNGLTVRLFDARAGDPSFVREAENWCSRHLGFTLPVTDRIDSGLLELWHDRCAFINPRTGEACRANPFFLPVASIDDSAC